ERVGLGQILHGLDQQALAFYIARVGSAFASFPVDVGWNRDSKNLGHEVTRFASTKLRVQVLGELSTGLGSSISPHVLIFSSYSQWKILALRRHDFGLAGRLQFENIIGKFLIQLDIRVLGQAEVAARLKYLLLNRDPARGINPHQNLVTHVAHAGGLGEQIQLCGLHAAYVFAAFVFHVKRLQQVVASATETQHQEALDISAVLAGGVYGHLIDSRLINLHLAI